MAITVTVEILQTTYTLLRQTRPFAGWSLPPACDVRFKVMKTDGLSGDFFWDEAGRPVIRLSKAKHQTLNAITMTVAHEMCHMRDHTRAHHGAIFNKLADQVCRYHHFDRGQF